MAFTGSIQAVQNVLALSNVPTTNDLQVDLETVTVLLSRANTLYLKDQGLGMLEYSDKKRLVNLITNTRLVLLTPGCLMVLQG